MIPRRVATTLLVMLALLSAPRGAWAAQGSGCMPTTGTFSGLVFATAVNAGLAALISSNSGSSAPATDCTAAPVKGQLWLDTSVTPNVLKQYDGASWLALGAIDATNHIWTPPIGGGIATIVSAATVDLGTVPQAYVSITGLTGPITSFGSSAPAGSIKVAAFASTPTVTHDGAAMILPGATSITVTPGDVWLVVHLGAGNWRVLSVQRASGQALVSPSVPIGTATLYSGFTYTVPEKHLRGAGQALVRADYPDLLAAYTSTVSVARVSGSAVLSGFADTSEYGTGQAIEGAGIVAGTTILSCASTTCTLSANATSSGTGNVTIFAHGNGNGTTTFTNLDCRGQALVALDYAADRLTSTYFGTAPRLGAAGGSQSTTMAQANLPNITFLISGSAASSTNPAIKLNTVGVTTGDTSINVPAAGGTQIGDIVTTPDITIQSQGVAASGGVGTPMSRVMPARAVNCLVRALP